MAKFGYDQTSGYDLDSEVYVNACKFTCNETVNYHRITAYARCTVAAKSIKFGVYSNKVANGKDYPDVLLRDTNLVSVPVGTQWITAVFTSDIQLTNGTKYWLADLGQSGGGYLYSRYHLATSDPLMRWVSCSNATYPNFPNPFPSGQSETDTVEMSIFCESQAIIVGPRMSGDGLTWIITAAL